MEEWTEHTGLVSGRHGREATDLLRQSLDVLTTGRGRDEAHKHRLLHLKVSSPGSPHFILAVEPENNISVKDVGIDPAGSQMMTALTCAFMHYISLVPRRGKVERAPLFRLFCAGGPG